MAHQLMHHKMANEISGLPYPDNLIIDEEWSLDGRPHRLDGPAVIQRNAAGSIIEEQWWRDGKLHREDGPALIDYGIYSEIIMKVWMLNGRVCRPGGEPAREIHRHDGVLICKVWYEDGLPVRRVDGVPYPKPLIPLIPM